MRGGRPNQAITIRAKLVEQYAPYTDLADLFSAAELHAPGPGSRGAPPARGGTTPESPASTREPAKTETPPDRPDGEPSPATDTPPEPKAPGDAKSRAKKPYRGDPESSSEVYQQFDNEFRS